MKVLVTGSSGFIGTQLLDQLTLTGHGVLGIDRQRPKKIDHEPFFQQVDILDKEKLRQAIASFGPDAVIHLAARVDLNEKNDLNGYAANIAGVENLLAAIRLTPSIKRGIFTSTQLVCRVGYVPKNETDYAPHTLYGESKVRTERIVRENDGSGCAWCLVRPTTVWGPGMSEHYQRFLRMIQHGRYFHVGRRPLNKSYSYVGNIAFQYVKILEAPAKQIHRGVFYLADYEPISLRAWAEAFQKEFGAKPIPTVPEVAARVLAKAGDLINACGFKRFPFNSFRLNNVLAEYCFDLAPTKEVCGTLPYTMTEGVRETVAWFKQLKRAQSCPNDLSASSP